jgi:hypothetical protein
VTVVSALITSARLAHIDVMSAFCRRRRRMLLHSLLILPLLSTHTFCYRRHLLPPSDATTVAFTCC